VREVGCSKDTPSTSFNPAALSELFNPVLWYYAELSAGDRQAANTLLIGRGAGQLSRQVHRWGFASVGNVRVRGDYYRVQLFS